MPPVVSRWQSVLSKNFLPARYGKLSAAHGALATSSVMVILPWSCRDVMSRVPVCGHAVVGGVPRLESGSSFGDRRRRRSAPVMRRRVRVRRPGARRPAPAGGAAAGTRLRRRCPPTTLTISAIRPTTTTTADAPRRRDAAGAGGGACACSWRVRHLALEPGPRGRALAVLEGRHGGSPSTEACGTGLRDSATAVERSRRRRRRRRRTVTWHPALLDGQRLDRDRASSACRRRRCRRPGLRARVGDLARPRPGRR